MIQRNLIVQQSTSRLNLFLRALADLVFSVPFLMCAALVVIIFIMSGCTHAVILPPCGTYEVKAKIHITKDRSTWPVKSQRPEVGGVSSTANEIWLRQEDFADWKTQQNNLGHEVEHLIQFKYRVFPNPDDEDKK